MTHTLLDRALPTWDVAECHAIDVAATPEVVYAAVLAYRPDRGRLFRLLMGLRAAPARLRVGGRGRGWAGTPRSAVGFVGWAERFGFSLLGESPGQEIVFGLVGCARSALVGGLVLTRSGWHRAANPQPGRRRVLLSRWSLRSSG